MAKELNEETVRIDIIEILDILKTVSKKLSKFEEHSKEILEYNKLSSKVIKHTMDEYIKRRSITFEEQLTTFKPLNLLTEVVQSYKRLEPGFFNVFPNLNFRNEILTNLTEAMGKISILDKKYRDHLS